MPNIDSIKRAARKEAWYGDSYNPFRKVRSSTWNTPRVDEEQAVGGNTLTHFQTAPLPESPQLDNEERENIPDTHLPTTNTATTDPASTMEPVMTNARSSEPGSSATASADKSESIPVKGEDQVQQGNKPRRRFVPGFLQKNHDEEVAVPEEEGEKKRPWYMGKKLHHSEPFTVRNQLQRTIFNSYVNILLLAAPVGIAINYAGIDGKIVFVINFIAIIPLAGLLSFATEEIALHVGESLGGLLNASFGYVFASRLHVCKY